MTTTMTCGRRICTSPLHKGQRWLPISYFHPHEWHDPETKTRLKRPQAWCKTCLRLKTRLRGGFKARQPSKLRLKSDNTGYIVTTEKERETYRQYAREKYANLTPEQKADKREYNRIRAEAKRREAGIQPRNFRKQKPRTKSPTVDAAPMLAWLDKHLAWSTDTVDLLCARAGVTESVVRKALRGDERNVALDTVDRLLIAAGEPWLLTQLYPPAEDAA